MANLDSLAKMDNLASQLVDEYGAGGDGERKYDYINHI